MRNYWDNLLQKSKDSLAKEIDEVSVLYSLVQLDKFAEDRGRQSEFLTLKLYRDWLVHTSLGWNPSLTSFFEKLDGTIDGIGNGSGKEVALQNILAPLNFEKLFKELSTLGIILIPSQQTLFIKSLVGGLIDAPLRREGKNVKEFRFTHEESRRINNESYFCHIQIQRMSGKYFDVLEFHYYRSALLGSPTWGSPLSFKQSNTK